MCYAVYIGTNTKQITGNYVAGQTDLYLEVAIQEVELAGLKLKFSKSNVYYVGSYQGCSCGFAYDPTDPNERADDDDEEETIKAVKSLKALVLLLENLTEEEDIEFYCCWEGDWEYPINYRKEIDIRQIKIGTNYFGLIEREFILFKKKANH